jgi:3-methylcrotonyl-CoA carboxylase alpha subunit
MFRRVLIANRGEIACRVIATCRRMGIHTIAIYSEADRHARHVRLADEAHPVGASPASQSYLDVERVVAVARQSRADAVHPGYGFLSENTGFAAACGAAGIAFIGPGAEAIRSMGLKHEAKALAEAAGVPVVPGYHGDDLSPALLAREADRIGFPLLVKAVAGGGGKGMRVVHAPDGLAEAVAAAGREAATSFKDSRILLEKFIERPRHIEVQVFGDTHGSQVHLFERECSIQRRYQKIIEESPSPFLSPDVRERMTSAAVRAAAAVGYVNAGTVEFVVGPQGDFYFLEMNTRLQVEHPVTEAVTGLDLVEWQLRVAAGEPLPLEQDRINRCGHAIEARLYSEDPRRGFLPATGRIERFAFPPEDAGWRVDRGVDDGDQVTVHYDPMIAKVIASGADRDTAIARMRQCLARTAVFGPATNLDLLRRIVAHADFGAGAMDTGYLDRHLDAMLGGRGMPGDAALVAAADFALRSLEDSASVALTPGSPWASGDAWRLGGLGQVTLGMAAPRFLRLRARRRDGRVEVSGDDVEASARVVHGEHDSLSVDTGSGERELTLVGHGRRVVVTDGETYEIDWVDPWPFESTADDLDSHPASPLPGRVVEVHVAAGQPVKSGDPLAVVEGMKMQHTVRAGRDGVVTQVNVSAGDQVDADAVLCDIDTRDSASD